MTAFGLGLAFSAPPGAVTAEALRRGLSGGFRSALLLELGSLIGDACWAALALVGAAFLIQNPLARLILGGIGIVLLVRLAWAALQAARVGSLPTPTQSETGSAFAVGAMLSLGNPFAIAFWLGVGTATVQGLAAQPRPSDFVIFFVGFMLAAFCWCLFVAGLVTWGRRLLSPRYVRWVNLLVALALAGFALSLLLQLAAV